MTRNLYQVDLNDELMWVLATDQAEALRIILDKEVNNHNDIEEIFIKIVCCENDIVNLIDKK